MNFSTESCIFVAPFSYFQLFGYIFLFCISMIYLFVPFYFRDTKFKKCVFCLLNAPLEELSRAEPSRAKMRWDEMIDCVCANNSGSCITKSSSPIIQFILLLLLLLKLLSLMHFPNEVVVFIIIDSYISFLQAFWIIIN